MSVKHRNTSNTSMVQGVYSTRELLCSYSTVVLAFKMVGCAKHLQRVVH